MAKANTQAKKKPKKADLADRHALYQEAVQDVEAEIDFVDQTYQELRGRKAKLLREDFCGTANTACEWVRRRRGNRAIGVDLDREVLDWGREHNLTALTPAEQKRIDLIEGDVLDTSAEPVDIVLAMNFSYFLFRRRDELREYFRSVRKNLKSDGLLIMDCYGGYDAPKELTEPRDCGKFTYIWDQAEFNPITNGMVCHIHFKFPDKSRLKRAFSYHWRLWSLPEITEILEEAGFSQSDVYWEGTDEETGEGDGIYEPATVGDADPGWICYIVAQP
jgi:SAM-dependent methyltransferase